VERTNLQRFALPKYLSVQPSAEETGRYLAERLSGCVVKQARTIREQTASQPNANSDFWYSSEANAVGTIAGLFGDALFTGI
jgi:hypothetical protein